MDSIGTVFEGVVSGAISGTVSLAVISNQSDGICTYTSGELKPVGGARLQGGVTMLFSDRVREIPEPDGPFSVRQPFNAVGNQRASATMRRSGPGSYEWGIR